VDCQDHLGEPMKQESPIRILCIGGAVVDRSYEADDLPAAHRSNPVRGRKSFGGVARNVAEVLVKLGAQVKLASLVGDDTGGQELVGRAEAAGIDVSLLGFEPGARTAEYIGVFHKGELFAAFADMEIFDRLDGSYVSGVLRVAGHFEGVFADCNLSISALQMLRQYCSDRRLPLAADSVSPAKAQRFEMNLNGVALLITNRDEAQAMSGESEPQAAIGILQKHGASAVVIGDGPAGVYAGDERQSFQISMPRVNVVNVNGAGDALAAGTFLRRLEGASLRQAVIFGMGCAYAALEWPTAQPSCFDRREASRRSRSIADGTAC
jgi:pseudouridine kinase